jgi:pimeloyl-ACP methyl ester carboxylesterase
MPVDLNHHRAGRGEPLLLIHGIGSRWQVWQPVLPQLQAAHEVVAIDLPGFGDSPMPPPGTLPGAASLTKLVCEFLDRLGIEAPHVGGNSLGGWVALELAKLGRAQTVTVLSPAGFHNDLEARFQHSSIWTTVRAARVLAPVAEPLLTPPLGRRLMYAQLAAHPERIPPADAVDHLRAFAHAPWLDATLPAITADRFGGGERIDVPVTIAWGEHDRLLLPRQARRAVGAIPSARLVTLRGCGHVPTYDDPQQVAAVLLEGSSGQLK